MEHRTWAHPFDQRVTVADPPTWGVSPSPDAVGGCYGMGWAEHFVDHKTGVTYEVHCSDGVYGGKDAHEPKHEQWMQAAFETLSEGAREAVAMGLQEFRISALEWNLLGNFVKVWLDGEAVTGEAPGIVGTCQGVPVVVDPTIGPLVGWPP